MNKLRLTAIILVLGFFTIAPARAQSRSREPAPLRVVAVIPYDMPPTYFVDKKTGKPTGFAVDLMSEIAKRAGLEVRYVFAMDWNDAVDKVVKGEAELAPDIGINEKRERHLAYSSVLEAFPVSFFVRAAHTGDQIRDGDTVGVIRGSIAFEEVKKHPNLIPVLYQSFQQGLFDLLSGKIDAFACPVPTFLQLARQSGVEDKIRVAGKPLTELKRAIAVRKDNVQLLEKINGAMEGFVGGPEYQRIYVKWYGKAPRYWTPIRVAGIFGVLLFIVISGMLVLRHITILRFNRDLKTEIERRRQAEEELRKAHEDLELKVVKRTFELGAANEELGRKIEELKCMEKTLRQSEEKFRTLFESAVDGLFILDQEGNFIDINKTAHERLGYAKEEMLSMHLSQLDPPEFAAILPQRIEMLKKNVQDVVFESAHRRKDSTVMPVEINSRVIDFEGKKVFFSIIRDITERKKAAEDLSKSEERYRVLFDQSPHGIVLIDTSGRILEFNETAHRRLGYSREEFAKLNLSTINPEESPEEFRTRIKKILTEGKAEFDVQHRTKQGEAMHVHVITQVLTLSGSRLIHSIWQDITERKRAEERIRESLGEKEVLLKEVHHRVKNNLQIVASMLALQAEYVCDDKTRKAFEESQKRIEAMSLIHQKLYRSPDLARVDFREYIDDLTSNLFFLNEGASSRIHLDTEIQGLSLDINTAIPCGFIINELISNALRHAFPDGREGRVFLSMHNDTRGKTTLVIKDDGIGFPESVDFRNANSLGLQLVIALVRQLNGTIDLEREGGTAFKVTFPGPNEGNA